MNSFCVLMLDALTPCAEHSCYNDQRADEDENRILSGLGARAGWGTVTRSFYVSFHLSPFLCLQVVGDARHPDQLLTSRYYVRDRFICRICELAHHVLRDACDLRSIRDRDIERRFDFRHVSFLLECPFWQRLRLGSRTFLDMCHCLLIRTQQLFLVAFRRWRAIIRICRGWRRYRERHSYVS